MSKPESLHSVAESAGFVLSNHLGSWNGYDVWGLHPKPAEGVPVPTGAPAFVLSKHGTARIATPDEGFEIIETFYSDGE